MQETTKHTKRTIFFGEDFYSWIVPPAPQLEFFSVCFVCFVVEKPGYFSGGFGLGLRASALKVPIK